MNDNIDLKALRNGAEKEGALTVSRTLMIAICDEIDLLRGIAEIKDPEQHFEQIMAANKDLQSTNKALREALENGGIFYEPVKTEKGTNQ